MYRSETKVPSWAGYWSRRRCAAVMLSATLSFTGQIKKQSWVRPPVTSLEFEFEQKRLALLIFLPLVSSRRHCGWDTARDLFKEFKTRNPVQRLCPGYSSYWNQQKQWEVLHNQKIRWVVCIHVSKRAQGQRQCWPAHRWFGTLTQTSSIS